MEIRVVKSKHDQKEFVKFPYRLYKADPSWIPPLLKGEYSIFEKDTNPALEFCDACFWIAIENGKTVGRICGIINHAYNSKIGKKMARFSRLEFNENPEIGKSLLAVAEKWAIEQGAEAIHGPLGFTNLDLQGLLIEGFEYVPSIASIHHKPYYQKVIEDQGYEKENDWVEFRLFLEDHIPEKATRLVDMIKQRYKLHVVSFKKTSELLPYGKKLFELLNQAFDELPYVSSFNDKTIAYYTKKYFSVLNPEFVKVVLNEENKMVGFIVGMPSLSVAMQKAGGHLFPFGFYHIMKALKNPVAMDLVLTGVDPHLQGQGIPAVLITELQQVLLKYKVPYVETTGIFESNQKAIQTWKNYENIQHKRRRCFVKKLS